MIKRKTIPPTPTKGDIKTVKKFAWLPKSTNEFWVWLDFYFVEYEYKELIPRGHIRNGRTVIPPILPGQCDWVKTKTYC